MTLGAFGKATNRQVNMYWTVLSKIVLLQQLT